MLGYIVLVRHERTHTTKLEDTFAAVEDGKLIYRCKVFTELLIIERVGNLSASALAGIERVDCFLAERLIQLFQRGRFSTAKEETTVDISRLRMVATSFSRFGI